MLSVTNNNSGNYFDLRLINILFNEKLMFFHDWFYHSIQLHYLLRQHYVIYVTKVRTLQFWQQDWAPSTKDVTQSIKGVAAYRCLLAANGFSFFLFFVCPFQLNRTDEVQEIRNAGFCGYYESFPVNIFLWCLRCLQYWKFPIP